MESSPRKFSHAKCQSYHVSQRSNELPLSARRTELPFIRSDIRIPLDHLLPNSRKKFAKNHNPATDYFEQEMRHYERKKDVILSGMLTTRGLRQILKPNRLKWEKRELRVDYESVMQTKLNVADFVLNTKGSIEKKRVALAQFKVQLDSPKLSPKMGSQRIIDFLGRIQEQPNSKKSRPPQFFKSERLPGK